MRRRHSWSIIPMSGSLPGNPKRTLGGEGCDGRPCQSQRVQRQDKARWSTYSTETTAQTQTELIRLTSRTTHSRTGIVLKKHSPKREKITATREREIPNRIRSQNQNQTQDAGNISNTITIFQKPAIQQTHDY